MQEIYLDNAATTRTHPEIARLALEMMCENYGNPSSLHEMGIRAQLAVDRARKQVAKALGCLPEELTFTSGGTEANNLAILGGAEALRRRGNTVVTTQVEHASVSTAFGRLEQLGFTVKRISPLEDGSLDVNALAGAVDEDTVLVSCMLVNSEVGAVSDIAAGVRAARKKRKDLLFHCDAVQAFGKLYFTPKALGVDLLTVSGHKIHAPKGVGALYVRRGARILPQTFGGGQERGLRPGTESTPLIAAFGLAAERSAEGKRAALDKVNTICGFFLDKAEKIQGICRNSAPQGTPYICNLSLPGYRSEILLHYLAEGGIYVSSGSACSRGEKSHVLTAMGLPLERIDSALRVSFSADNTAEDVERFFARLERAQKEILTAK